MLNSILIFAIKLFCKILRLSKKIHNIYSHSYTMIYAEPQPITGAVGDYRLSDELSVQDRSILDEETGLP